MLTDLKRRLLVRWVIFPFGVNIYSRIIHNTRVPCKTYSVELTLRACGTIYHITFIHNTRIVVHSCPEVFDYLGVVFYGSTNHQQIRGMCHFEQKNTYSLGNTHGHNNLMAN